MPLTQNATVTILNCLARTLKKGKPCRCRFLGGVLTFGRVAPVKQILSRQALKSHIGLWFAVFEALKSLEFLDLLFYSKQNSIEEDLKQASVKSMLRSCSHRRGGDSKSILRGNYCVMSQRLNAYSIQSGVPKG